MSLRKKRNLKNLALDQSPIVGSESESKDAPLNDLEIGVELRLDLRTEDLKHVNELGSGNGGVVNKVMHVPTHTIMARKVIHVDANPNVRKQIIRELQILHDCNSPHIVSFYGAFMTGGDICLCMEYMDLSSFDRIYKKNGPIPMDIVGKACCAVLDGLIYLYDKHRIIHRDVKPSNILMNSSGLIKICDFGVSGVLINSMASTFVGTSNYMSPERIKGATYTVKSDVWSLGLTLMELALGRFPFPEGSSMSVFELMQFIVNEPSPTLPADQFPAPFVEFCQACLLKDPDQRPTPKQLMELSPFAKLAAAEKVDVEKWARTLV
ncbi:MAP kinase kinase (MEK) [Tieghemiomyces parasiticus]|uniref:MAP kinase kinase (MEK) n=1 Tax=Tieghemiomyces parasiticus TaxID=78921 RepID=A0A9W7ZU04_9FUNG|nr:MAP kinase kinase (MEK) [Tieghemiomyces parasiticus]KAJ1916088.1 MAP kinase kinase (MEK) [Tieghemiomyces parasiticus]